MADPNWNVSCKKKLAERKMLYGTEGGHNVELSAAGIGLSARKQEMLNGMKGEASPQSSYNWKRKYRDCNGDRHSENIAAFAPLNHLLYYGS